MNKVYNLDTMINHLNNPYQRALLTVGGIVGFSLLATLAIWGLSSRGLTEPALIWIGFSFFAFFSLMELIIWLLGQRQVWRASEFLSSERLLVHWTYSQEEWQQLKANRWTDEKDDWKIQWGCLTLLLSLAGLMTGILLGLEEGWGGVIVNGFIGLLLGGLAGVALGAVVAGGNYLGARQDYHRSEPGCVALGTNEIYASNDYFKGDGVKSYIREVKLRPGKPTMLEFLLVFPPRPRMPLEEQWAIPVPARFVERVEEILPLLAPGSENQVIE